MPLVKSGSDRALKKNISTLMGEVGKSPKVQSRDQALAIAYSIKRRKKRRYGGRIGYEEGGLVELSRAIGTRPARTVLEPFAPDLSSLIEGKPAEPIAEFTGPGKVPQTRDIRPLGALGEAASAVGDVIGGPPGAKAAGAMAAAIPMAARRIAAPAVTGREAARIITPEGFAIEGPAFTRESKRVLDEIAKGPKGAGPLDLSGQLKMTAPQHALPRYDPPRGVSPRMRDAMENPDVVRGVLESIEAGKRLGAHKWYHTEPIRQGWTDVLGSKAGPVEFGRNMDYTSTSSPRSKVPPNIANASYYYWLGDQPLPRKNPYPYGHLAQKHHRENFMDLREGGWDFIENPKPPSYGANLQGNLIPVALDAHAFKNIGMRTGDPRFLASSIQELIPFRKSGPSRPSEFQREYAREIEPTRKGIMVRYGPRELVESGRMSMEEALKIPPFWDAAPKKNEYAAGERFWSDLAGRSRLKPAEGQSAGWAGGGELTGLGTVATHTFPEMFNERNLYTSMLRNEDMRKTFEMLVRKQKPLLGIGAGGVGAGALARGEGEWRGGRVAGFADGGGLPEMPEIEPEAALDPAVEAEIARGNAAARMARSVKPEAGRIEGDATDWVTGPEPLAMLGMGPGLRAAGTAIRYAPKLAAGFGSLVGSMLPSEVEADMPFEVGSQTRSTALTPRQLREQVRARDLEARMAATREAEQAKATMPEPDELAAMGFTPQSWLGASADERKAARSGIALRKVDRQLKAEQEAKDRLRAQAPFRERHPEWAQAAPYIASGVAGALPFGLRALRKYAFDVPYGKAWNKTLGETAKAIDTTGRTSPQATRGVAELEARMAEAPKRATGTNWPVIGSAGLGGAEGMAFPEQLDYLGQPKGTRAYQEAEAAFTNPAYLAKLGLSSLSAASAAKLGDVVGKQAFRTEYPTAATAGVLAPIPKQPRARPEPIDRALLAERLRAEGMPGAVSGKLPYGPPIGRDAAGRFTFQGPDGQWRYQNGKLVPDELLGKATGGRIVPRMAFGGGLWNALGGAPAMSQPAPSPAPNTGMTAGGGGQSDPWMALKGMPSPTAPPMSAPPAAGGAEPMMGVFGSPAPGTPSVGGPDPVSASPWASPGAAGALPGLPDVQPPQLPQTSPGAPSAPQAPSWQASPQWAQIQQLLAPYMQQFRQAMPQQLQQFPQQALGGLQGLGSMGGFGNGGGWGNMGRGRFGMATGGTVDHPLAAAARIRRANGGEIPMPAVENPGPLHEGPVVSDVPGRTDQHNVQVRAGSYVLPSSHVASLGQDNTIAGLSVLDKMFKSNAPPARKMRAGRGIRRRRADGGGLEEMPLDQQMGGAGWEGDAGAGEDAVPIVVAGGEYILTPEQVAQIGEGDIRRGHEVLDAWVKRGRKDHIRTLQKLPGPAKT